MARCSIVTVCTVGLGIASLLVGTAASSSRPAPIHESKPAKSRKVDFNRDVRPILSEHCYRCHGPDAAAVAADLRLDLHDSATADRGGYRAITPGDVDASLAFQRASSSDADLRMPPESSGMTPLNENEIAVLKAWIEGGAEYRPHWAFVSPEEPTAPVVNARAWVRRPLDTFVLAALEEENLAPEERADLRTLARRASLVLTGLPPHPATLDRITASRSRTAYEDYVDELLASPQYGEHQARYWLDAVRYGDTHGLHLDNERSVWPYRDWVVRAYNDDLPLDKFVTWQLAGDLLPFPTRDQLIATGFVRMNPTTAEGGSIEEEVLAKNTFDRTDTAMTVLTGLTVGCAKCHDHKYDPITQKEYYGLYGYFNNTEDAPLDGNAPLPPPIVQAPSAEQEIALSRVKTTLMKIEDGVDISAASRWVAGARTPQPTVGTWQISPIYPEGSFDLAYSNESTPKESEWRPIQIQKSENKAAIIRKENAYVYLRTTIKVESDRDLILALGSDDAIKVWVNGSLVHENKALRGLTPGADRVTTKLKAGSNSLLFKIINAAGQDGFVYSFGDPKSERIEASFAATRKPAMNAKETSALKQTFLLDGPDSKEATAYRESREALTKLEAEIPSTLIAIERTTMPRKTFLLRRGEYDLPGDEVQRGIPAALGQLPKGAPNDRLGLAQWFVAPQNPLLTRVYVNRVWQQCFGTGIVQSMENFGNQGAWPTNRDLLDHLAVLFQKGGLSTKDLLREIVTSATFMQSSATGAEKLAKDPRNLLNSRGPRFRLDAEVVRDQALFASGLINTKMGGPGVKTYQPPGLWEAVAYTSSNTAKYVQDHGDALYRRSLYLFWKRTSPPPMMSVFDAPSREACVLNRSRTNTPLQALIGLNGTQFVEAARVMAERVIEISTSDTDGVVRAFEKATCRKPSVNEIKVVLNLLEKSRRDFKTDPNRANALVTVGEHPRNEWLDTGEVAAWTVVCNMVLNLDETLTVH